MCNHLIRGYLLKLKQLIKSLMPLVGYCGSQDAGRGSITEIPLGGMMSNQCFSFYYGGGSTQCGMPVAVITGRENSTA